MISFNGRSAARTGAAIVAAVAFAQVAQAAPITVTTAPAGHYSYMDWERYTLGQVNFATGTNQILGLTTSVDLVDQGWGGSGGTNGVFIQLVVDGDSLWDRWVAGAGHSWTNQTFDIANDDAAFAALNTALGTVDWTTASSVSMRMQHSGYGWSGWSLRTANATMSVTSDATPAVPEPATWALMMLGFGGIGFAMRRRNAVTTRIRFA